MKDEKIQLILSYGPNGDPDKSGYNAYIATNKKHAADFEDEQGRKLKSLKGKLWLCITNLHIRMSGTDYLLEAVWAGW
ncbi:MAG: hypothetical protein ACLT16_20235 [[Clostridium] innocuum]